MSVYPASAYDQEYGYRENSRVEYQVSNKPHPPRKPIARPVIFVGLIICGFILLLIPMIIVIAVFKSRFNPNNYVPENNFPIGSGAWGPG
uniref:Uncharacterized protein n=1 Tax=Acrobeloides nanus TaxID=290746 RepID=A0A914DFM0_9BILA